MLKEEMNMKKNGKKLVAILSALLLAVMMIGTAAAEAINPLPPTVDINNLKDRFVTTDITYKEGDIVTLTLYEDEVFDAEAIKAVKEGDVITTDGAEVTVTSVTWDGIDVYFNKGTETEMLFCDTGKGTFEHVLEVNDLIPQVKIGTMEVELLPYMTMLDGVDAGSGEPLETFVVRSGEDLLNMLKSDNASACFDVQSIRILYDGNNVPQLIWRFYSPLQ